MRSVISVTLNKGKQMGFGFKQPLVGKKRCVTTLITAAKETIWSFADHELNSMYLIVGNFS